MSVINFASMKASLIGVAAVLFLTQQASSAEQGDPRICEPLRTVAEAPHKKFGLESLVDRDIEPITSEDPGLNEIYTSKIKLGNCLLDIHASVQKHICLVPMTVNDPKAITLYHDLNKQVQLCLADMITQSKIAKKIKKSATQNNVAFSLYELGDKIKFFVNLGDYGRCSEITYDGCEDGYGVTIGTIVKE